MTEPAPRAHVIDLIKGLACTAIIWHHLAFYGPMSDAALPLFPRLIDWLYDYGRMAVQMFLVLGGYLAAASLAPQGQARFKSAWHPIGRRFIRLTVPYIAAMVVALLAAALVRPWLDHPSVPSEPGLTQLLAHALLLQSVLDEESLSAGVWYVAIDFQLFAFTVLLFAGVRALPGLRPAQTAVLGKLLVASGVAASLLVFNRHPALDVWGIYFFGAYGLGMMACWAVQAKRPMYWLVLMGLLGAVALAVDFRGRILLALLTALGLVWALRQRWQVPGGAASALLQRTGQHAYSIFLLHFPVCLVVNAVFNHLWPQAALPNAVGMLLAFWLSLWAGSLMYRRIERCAATWGQTAQWQAGLVGTGMLLMWLEA